jgi:hypothetical protein
MGGRPASRPEGHQSAVLNDLQIGRHERHGRHTARNVEIGLPLD